MNHSFIRPRPAGVSASFLAALAGVLLLADARYVNAAAEPAAVQINQFQFEPQELTVKRGATVVWTNRDQTIHNVVAKEGKFASAGLDTGDRFSFHFDHEGDYPYVCALHPHMVGIVHVRAP